MKREECATGGATAVRALVAAAVAATLLLAGPQRAEALFTDCAVSWNSFVNNPGFTADYTYLGQPIRDHESTGSGDPSRGSANVPPAETDLASAATAAVNPGVQTTPIFGFYNGGTIYDPADPSTYEDDVVFFRMRITGQPYGNNKTDFNSYHWNILLDLDADGYKEYWVDLEGACLNKDCPGGVYDRLNVLYNNENRQDIADADAAGVRVDYFQAQVAPDNAAACTAADPASPGYSHTRAIPVTAVNPLDTSGDWYIDIQVPLTAFNDSQGNQVLLPNSPVAFVFSTGASNQDPLQKDHMMDLKYLSNVDPIVFGDVVIPDGTPRIQFTDAAWTSVDFYTTDGDRVYFSLVDRSANTTGGIDHLDVTVVNPASGDEATMRLCETGPTTGIFFPASNGSCAATVATLASYTDPYTPDLGDLVLGANSGETLRVTYTSVLGVTVEDTADVVAPCEAYLQFTRVNGLPTDNFIITNNPATSDKLYVTVYGDPSAYNPATQDTIQVSLTGTFDAHLLTLYETAVDSAVFRNYNYLSTPNPTDWGLATQITDGTVVPNVAPWEDVDGGTVTATYGYTCGGSPYTRATAAQLFATSSGGKVYFVNQAGTLDVERYGSGQTVYVKVVDLTSAACGSTPAYLAAVDVTVRSLATGDAETITLAQTAAGSGVYLNQASPVRTVTYDHGAAGVTAGDGYLEAADGEALRVDYTDRCDGDGVPGNNVKSDDASFNAPALLISEVLFAANNENACPDPGDPPPDPLPCDDRQREYLMLYNASAGPVALDGYRVTDEDADFDYTFATTVTLQPGERAYLFLYESVSPLQAYDGSSLTVDGGAAYFFFAPVQYAGDPGSGTVVPLDYLGDATGDSFQADTADQLTLYAPGGAVVDFVAWSASATTSADFRADDTAAVDSLSWTNDAYRAVFDRPGIEGAIALGDAIVRGTVSGGTVTPAYAMDTNVPADWVYATPTVDAWELTFGLTPVLVSRFGAFDAGGVVVTAWETAYERGTLGFFVQRRDGPSGGWRRVSPHLLPAALAPQGGRYAWVDAGANPEDLLTYRLEELTATGGRSFHGPFTVRPERSPDPAPDEPYTREPRPPSGGALERLSGARASALASGPSAEPAARRADLLRVLTAESGLHLLEAPEIAAGLGIGVLEARRLIRSRGLALANLGRRVAWHPAAGNRGVLFFAETVPGDTATRNTYWLRRGRGLAMRRAGGEAPAAGTGATAFTGTLHLEQDVWPMPHLVDDPAEDFWAWDFLIGGVPGEELRTLPIEVPGAALTGTAATLSLRLWAAAMEGASGRHRVRVSINGTPVGEHAWEGRDGACAFSFPEELLRSGENALTVEDLLPPGEAYDFVVLDAAELRSGRSCEADGDALTVAGPGPFTVGGFGAADVLVLDLERPDRPRLAPASLEGVEGAYAATFAGGAGPRLAVAASAAKRPVAVIPARAPRLRSRSQRADLVVVVPAALRPGIARLVRHRRAQGLAVKVVSPQRVYDAFSHGIPTPSALKDFLAHARRRWERGPRYALLVGEGTWDYRDRLGFGDNLLPPLLTGSGLGLVASDSLLGDVDDDGLLEVAVGRLPVATAEEAAAVAAKILAAERTGGRWRRRALWLSDDPDGAGDFPADAERIAARLPRSVALDRISLADLAVDDARERLFLGLGAGAGFVNYVGHAGVDTLAEEGLLSGADVPLLPPGRALPAVTAFTCAIGTFDTPGHDSLAEALVVRPGGGAAAVWSPTGVSINGFAGALGQEFYAAAFDRRFREPRRAGDVVRSAVRAFRRRAGSRLPELYNWLGDPTMFLR